MNAQEAAAKVEDKTILSKPAQRIVEAIAETVSFKRKSVELVSSENSGDVDPILWDFYYYWTNDTIAELRALGYTVEEIPGPEYRYFFRLFKGVRPKTLKISW